MSDNKKYYYLKLKDNHFNTEDMKLLESMKNGYEYSSLYLKLCLLSLKGEGKLLYKNRIPYKPEMLATITGHSLEVIEYAIPILQQLEMLTILDNGTIYIDDIQNLVGHGSTEGERKALYRKKLKQLGQSPDICTPEKELEKEKEKEKETNKRDKKRFKKPTKDELSLYCKEINFNLDIDAFCDYQEARGWELSKGRKIKDWKAVVRTWAKNDKLWNKDKPESEEVPRLDQLT